MNECTCRVGSTGFCHFDTTGKTRCMQRIGEAREPCGGLAQQGRTICQGHINELYPEEANAPGAHYDSGGMQAIHVIEAFKLGFNLGNAVKYILRAGKKGDRNEDLQKAINYLHREMTGSWPK